MLRKNLINFLLILFITTIFLTSCINERQSFYDKIEGQWAISEIEYAGKNYKNNLYYNLLVFGDENKVSIPETTHFIKDDTSTWEVIEGTRKVKINSSNLAFKDVFKVEFIKPNAKNPLGMILRSDSIYIKAYKFLQFGE